MSNLKQNLDLFLSNYNFDKSNYNFIIQGSNNLEKFDFVESIIDHYYNNILNIKIDNILGSPDVINLSLPLYDKSGKKFRCLDNEEMILANYGIIDTIDTMRIGKEITIDQIRDLNNNLVLSSHYNHKFVIMNLCDHLNKEASASLLKTLEETKSKTVFFLIVNELSIISETIVSRCQKIQYQSTRNIDTQESFHHYFLSKYPEINLLHEYSENISVLKNIVDDLSRISEDKSSPLKYSSSWSKGGKIVLDYLVELFMTLLKHNCGNKKNDKLSFSQDLAKSLSISTPKLLKIISFLFKKKAQLININVNKQLFFDDLLIVIRDEL